MERLVIVSNRLPVTPALDENGAVVFPGSVGGLATGLGSFYRRYESLWIGLHDPIEGTNMDDEAVRACLFEDHSCLPVLVDADDAALYYQGFSNETIWPVFHHFPQYAIFDRASWDAYTRVNERFADAVAEAWRPGDLVWVNDYHLMLLPGLLRERLPTASIGFFLHIPFPSFEIFRMLPWRDELIDGLLGADLVGFHTYDYARHFLSSALRLKGLDQTFSELSVNGRTVRVDAFPMGIDYERFAAAAGSAEVEANARDLRRQIGDRAFVLSVDRLDYSKGIPARLAAFAQLLDEHPEWHERVSLTMVAVPSRTDVEHYQLLKREVDELVGRINGEYGTMDWTPVHYLYRSLPFDELVALYREADVMLVTPLRDGMNLVAKEYVATKGDSRLGVLVLSELAGAATELGEALIVNPFDSDALVDALGQALGMPADEQRQRLTAMQDRLRRYDVIVWAEDFTGALEHSREHLAELEALSLGADARDRLETEYRTAGRRLLLLDYDGTLMDFSKQPESVVPDDELRETLRALATTPSTEVVIISGRSRSLLEEWLGDLDVSLVAEHGGLSRRRGGVWQTDAHPPERWKDAIRPVMERFVQRTPGTFIEEKETALVWHYRAADPGLGPERSRELRHALGHLTENLDLAVMEGKRVLEVKAAGVNKGRAALTFIEGEPWDFVLAVGDDRTDEDVFGVVPDMAWSIKVGGGPSLARFRVPSVAAVRDLLERLAR
jgi:trehalose 6-phosphate synthase/phosphatase